jgi:putative spermidine/putrescine transport system ATP-binding protein
VIFSKPVNKHHPVIIVFQDYVLFPAMTVKDNIGFGLKARHLKKSRSQNRWTRCWTIFS